MEKEGSGIKMDMLKRSFLLFLLLLISSIGQEAIAQVMKQEHLISYNAGLYKFNVLNIASSKKGINVSLDRSHWPSGKVAELTIIGRGEGQDFTIGPVSLSGGRTIGRNGIENAKSSLSWTWPGEALKDEKGNYVLDAKGQRIRREIKIKDVEVQLKVLQNITTQIKIDTIQ